MQVGKIQVMQYSFVSSFESALNRTAILGPPGQDLDLTQLFSSRALFAKAPNTVGGTFFRSPSILQTFPCPILPHAVNMSTLCTGLCASGFGFHRSACHPWQHRQMLLTCFQQGDPIRL